MRILILAFLTSLSFTTTSAFSGEIKNVGVICRKIEVDYPLFIAFWFKGNEQLEWYHRDGDTMEISLSRVFNDWKYNSTDSYIYLNKFNGNRRSTDWKIKIDRFTLKMEQTFYSAEWNFQCEVISPKEDFLSELKNKENIIREHFAKRKL